MIGAPRLPAGLIADPDDAMHVATMISTVADKRPPMIMRTRRTTVNFAVCCLIDLTQREAAARAVAPGFDCSPPAWADDDVPARHPSA